MATTVGAFTAIDDTEVDAESPITESLATRLRDNAYWLIEGTTLTTETASSQYLETDGTGGVQWTPANGSNILDGEKGTISLVTTSWVTLTAKTGGLLFFDAQQFNSGDGVAMGYVKIDLSDDTYVTIFRYGIGGATTPTTFTSTSATITTGQTVMNLATTSAGLTALQFRRDSGNLQYRISSGSVLGFHASHIIL